MEQQNENIIAAIDVGTTKVVVLVGRKDEKGNIEIIGYGRTESNGVRRGSVLNIEATIKSIKDAVAKAEETSGYKITEAYVGIAGYHIRSQRFTQIQNRNSANDPISADDIKELINQMRNVPTEMGEEVLHILPQDYKVDSESEIESPIGMNGKQLSGDFHIVFGQTAAANNLRRCVENNGIKVKRLILEPLASSTAVLTKDDKDLGVALVDIGGGTTDLAIFKNGRIFHTEVIPIGGNVITNDIKTGCNILERQAESLKVQYGSAIRTSSMGNKSITIPGTSGLKPKEISLSNLAEIINARIAEIIATISYHIKVSGANNLGAGIVVTGGGAMLRSLPQLFANQTGMEIRIGVPNKLVKSHIEAVTSLPSNSTSIGLMMMGLDNKLTDGMDIEFKVEKNASNTEPVAKDKNDDDFVNEMADEKKESKTNNTKQKVLNAWGKFVNFVTTEVETD